MAKQNESLVDIYPSYPLPRLSREKVRQVKPSKWRPAGLRHPREGKWKSYWITAPDLVEWSGGMPKLLAKYRTVDEVLDCLWRTYEREVPFIYEYFIEVNLRDQSKYRQYCEKFFAS